MTAVSFQGLGAMDFSHPDDEMQIHSDMVMPEDVDLDDADLMRDASIEPDQDLMNQDPVEDDAQPRDDDMLDDEVIDEGSMTMADEGNVDVVQNMDEYNDDEDIIYEDEEEPVNIEHHSQSDGQDLEDSQVTNEQSSIQKSTINQPSPEAIPNDGLQGLQNITETGPGSQTGLQDLSQPQPSIDATSSTPLFANETLTESSDLTGLRGTVSSSEPYDLAGAAVGDDNPVSGSKESPSVDNLLAPRDDDIHYTTSGDSATNATSFEKDGLEGGEERQEDEVAKDEHLKELTYTGHENHDVHGNTDHHESTEEVRFEVNNEEDSRQVLHPVLIHYAQAEFSLFPPHDEDDVSDFFVEDESLANQGLDKLLSSCREVLAGSIGDHDEMVLDIPRLGLHISEGSLYASQISLSQVIDVYLMLHHNDGTETVSPLICDLQTRICLASQYNFLQQAAQGGKGLLEIPNVAAKGQSHPEVKGQPLSNPVSAKSDNDIYTSESSSHIQSTDNDQRVVGAVNTSADEVDLGAQAGSGEQSQESDSTLAGTTTTQRVDDANHDKTNPDIISDKAEKANYIGGAYDGEQDEPAQEGNSPAFQSSRRLSSSNVDDLDILVFEADFIDHLDDSPAISTIQAPLPGGSDHAPGNGAVDADNANQRSHIELDGLNGGEESLHFPELESNNLPQVDEEHLSTKDEDLFDETHTNELDHSAATQDSQEHSKPGYETVTRSTEVPKVSPNDAQTSHQSGQNHQVNSGFEQIDYSNTSAAEDGEVRSDDEDYDEIDVNENGTAQYEGERVDTHEDDSQSVSSLNDRTKNPAEGTPYIGESMNTSTELAANTSPGKTELDILDFDFVEHENDTFLESLSTHNVAQSAEKTKPSTQDETDLGSTPPSSKRKARDATDGSELGESTTSDSKRRRNS